MKRITLGLAAFAIAGGLMAQDSGFSAGLDIALPMGDLGKVYSFGLGPALTYEREAGSSGLAGISVAYTIMFPKEDIVKSGAVIPIQGQYKYFFDDVREGVYVGAMFGYAIQTMKFKEETVTVGGVTTTTGGGSVSNNGLGLAPVVGYVVNERLDLGLRYQIMMTSESNDGTISSGSSTSSSAYLGIRAAYNF